MNAQFGLETGFLYFPPPVSLQLTPMPLENFEALVIFTEPDNKTIGNATFTALEAVKKLARRSDKCA